MPRKLLACIGVQLGGAVLLFNGFVITGLLVWTAATAMILLSDPESVNDDDGF
jgi:hypothetical protein